MYSSSASYSVNSMLDVTSVRPSAWNAGKSCSADRRRLPVGRQHQDERPPQLAHDIGEQDRRRLVRPLQIIEHQQQPVRPGRLGQPPANLREHREPLGAAGIGAIS